MGVSVDCGIFLLRFTIFGASKATNFKFRMHFNTINRNKLAITSPLTISGNVAVTVARDSHIGRIARSSLR